ncbi:hypothetical protein N0V84_007452 [Fusarium piperis]|uniref:Zn(2)-C6 fungal-type domain-containing protein n=1 Tax=Fusarium piperis TaxID=1435070 RepID=A0A9W8WA24_9HYPO|nr:hypothetical protein N0V84_007452 [Fusarium piperis]
MPSLKSPCSECKGKHLKCDDNIPKCHRCRTKGLQCIRPGRKWSFRHGSSAKYDAQFPDTQNWVNSSAKDFRFHTGPGRPARRIAAERDTNARLTSPPIHGHDFPIGDRRDLVHTQVETQAVVSHETLAKAASKTTPGSPTVLHSAGSDGMIPSSSSVEHLSHSNPSNYRHVPTQNMPGLSQRGPSWGGILHSLEPPQDQDRPLGGVQEACLFRYYVEELSHWFDLVDPQRLFQLLVPERARKYPPLLNAIFAVSTRRMCRVATFKTPQGIIYRGQHLPNLTPGSAVEYMLKCIPVLKEFHATRDGEARELIVTTAVVLRQFEEIDDEGDDDNAADAPMDEQVNFLAILNAVLRSLTSDDLAHHRELLNASYWIALRQEVYYALRRGYSPQMVEPPAEWADISPANKLIFHTSQATKWLFEDRSETGWQRLKEQERYLEQYVVGRFAPILSRPPDRTKGEVFPTIWYASNIALTGMQHMMIAKMILVAESPSLGRGDVDARAAYRKAEGDVRSLVLDVCSTAVQHPETPPALVNATLAIQLYGNYFTDPWERDALKGIVQMFKDCQAWPVPKALRALE